MLYNGNNPVLRVVGVEHISWDAGRFEVEAREYSALAFRIKGSAVIENSIGKHIVNTNDILYLPQNMCYTADYTETEIIAVHFVTESDDNEIEIYTTENGEEPYKLFLKAQSFWQRKEPGFAVYAMSVLYKILGTILEKETKSGLPPHFLAAISFINSNYRRSNISIAEICSSSGMSETMFRKLFAKHYRKTPIEYITDLRLEYARNLISSGVSVEMAAYDSGFNDSKYFARVVKNRFGCTPREFKNYGK